MMAGSTRTFKCPTYMLIEIAEVCLGLHCGQIPGSSTRSMKSADEQNAVLLMHTEEEERELREKQKRKVSAILVLRGRQLSKHRGRARAGGDGVPMFHQLECANKA